MSRLPNLPVYEAYKPFVREGGGVIALFFAVLTTPITLGLIAATYDNYQKGGVYAKDSTSLFFPFIIIGLVTWLNIWLFRVYLRARKRINAVKEEFKSKGITTLAKIVGKERVDGGESADDFYIYYQFQSTFIVKAILTRSKEKTYFNLPEGSEIEIEYIKDNPTKSRLKT
jgi:hypothetical protein